MSDDDEELEWDDGQADDAQHVEEEEEQNDLFQLLLAQHVESNKQQLQQEASPPPLAAASKENLDAVVQRRRGQEERARETKLAREQAKEERDSSWLLLRASLLGKIALCLRSNQSVDEEEDAGVACGLGGGSLPPTTLGEVQRFLGKFRAMFRQGAAAAADGGGSVWVTKEGSEMQLCQALRALVRRWRCVPARLVLRVQHQNDEGFDDRKDVWVELFVQDKWHRAFASIARVVREEEDLKKLTSKGGGAGSRMMTTPCGKLDSCPWKLAGSSSSSSTATFVLAVGDGQRLTLVTRRYYLTVPHKRVHEFVGQIVRQWNDSLLDDASSSSEVAYAAHTWTAQAMQREEALMQETSSSSGGGGGGQCHQLPTTRAEFAARDCEFVLQSDLGKYRQVKPGIKPVDWFKGEPVYRRRDQVVDVLTEYMWRRRGRRVMAGEGPVRVLGDGDEEAEEAEEDDDDDDKRRKRSKQAPVMRLFSHEQTEPIDFGEAGEDGSVPKNEFGNVESWGLPRACVHLTIAHVERACGALKVPFAPCVVGFERQSFAGGGNDSARSGVVKPKFDGVVIAQLNELLVRAQADVFVHQERQQRERAERVAVLQEWQRLLEANWTLATSNLGRLMMEEEE